ncbi:MAG: EAL and GGDEF domain-containing protein [Proteobacteria bacterium]|nr:EAL and GGDEF domain-containing protein [Pseudomonadota bacterium]
MHTVFQPILDGATREPIGYEALTRGPDHHSLNSPIALIALAAKSGLSTELECACIDSALASYRRLRLKGRLFVNVLPQTLLDWDDFPEWLADRLSNAGIDPHDVVIELTEHGLSEDETQLAAAVVPLRALGCDIAIDDLGAGSSGLKTWSAIRPDYVKVDRYFVAGVEQDAVRTEILRSVVDMGRVTGCRIIAEGVENREQFALALELGVDYLQGYLFGQPARSPTLDMAMLESLETAKAGITADCAGHLVIQIPGVDAAVSVADVVEMFRKEPTWTALAVLEKERPIGMVHRDDLLIFLSRPLHPEVYNRKPVASVMNRAAVQIDARARLDQVSRLVTARTAGRPRDDFIVTRNGRYLGMGRTIDLLRHITAQQIQAAKQSNPLTGLPGNREIQTHIAQWLACRRSFVACHLDLDHFKAFNDAYGYARGDQVLLHVAQVVTHAARPRVDFVGHVGGDDFVFLMRSQDWSLRLTAIVEELEASLANFHSVEHRKAGGLDGVDRDGVARRFPLLSASIAAVEIDSRKPVTAEEVADALQATKRAAKAKAGCSCMLAVGNEITDLSVMVPKVVPSPLSQMGLFAVGAG